MVLTDLNHKRGVYYLTGFNMILMKYLTVCEKQHLHHVALYCSVTEKHAFIPEQRGM